MVNGRNSLNRIMIRILRNSFGILLVCLITACSGDEVVYHQYQSIGDGWKKKDTLSFKVPPTDSIKVVNLYAELRNTSDYIYSDFYLVVKQNLADSLVWKTDTIHFQLANNNGEWLGKGMYHYQTSCLVKRIKLPLHPFHGTIRASQCMKDDVIKGISDVGFRIEY